MKMVVTFRDASLGNKLFVVLDDNPGGIIVWSVSFGLSYTPMHVAKESTKSGEWHTFSTDIPNLIFPAYRSE